MDNWISVEDRIPSNNRKSKKGQVLALRSDGHYLAAWCRDGVFHVGFRAFNDVTHWMPLPEPPKQTLEIDWQGTSSV